MGSTAAGSTGGPAAPAAAVLHIFKLNLKLLMDSDGRILNIIEVQDSIHSPRLASSPAHVASPSLTCGPLFLVSCLLEEAPPVQHIITMMLSFIYIFNVLVFN